MDTQHDATLTPDRRRFLMATGTAAAGAALPLGAASLALPTAARGAEGRPRQIYTIGTRKLGGLEVSELGFGCMSNSPGHYGSGVDRARSIRVIRDAYERVLGRPAAAQEIDRALAFIGRVERAMEQRKENVGERRVFAWQSFCKSLIASNEFIYLN